MPSSGLQLLGGVRTGITALSGGTGASTYTSANTLDTGTNVVTVCALAGDAVMLPTGTPQGAIVRVINLGVAACDITPNVGGTLNGGAATIQRSIAAAGGGATCVQMATDGNTWVCTGSLVATV